MKNLTKYSIFTLATIIAYTPNAIAQSGIFDEGTDKGNQILEEFIDGPARLIAGVAIVGAVVLFFMGKLPLKVLAMIIVGSLLLASLNNILDFLFG